MVEDQPVLITFGAAPEWKVQLKKPPPAILQHFSAKIPLFKVPFLPAPAQRPPVRGRKELCPPQWLLATCRSAATPWEHTKKKLNFSLPTAGKGTNLWIRRRVAGVNLFALWIRTLRPTLEWRKTNQRRRVNDQRAQFGVSPFKETFEK